MAKVGKVLDTNMKLDSFATLSAIQGKQFGREVYSTVIKFNDLSKFLQVFPQVQRDIVPRKVASIRRYILSGLEDNGFNMRFFSSLTVSCKGFMFYDDSNKRLAIDIHNSKLSINDGQHRNEAIITAIDYLEEEFAKSKDKSKTSKIREMIEELHNMTIPVVIFNGLSEEEEKQLFYDLNSLAQRPSRNSNIRLNQADLFARMSRELSEENRYLKHYGVEIDKSSIHESNPNTILLSTVYSSIKEVLGSEYSYDHNFLNEKNYMSFKEKVSETFDKMFYALPHDISTKGKYLTEKSYCIKAITRFICHARNHLDLQLSDDEIFIIISEIDWSHNAKFWGLYNGIKGATGHILFGGGTSGGYKGVYDALIERATTQEFIEARRRKLDLIRDMETRVSASGE